MGDQPVEHAVDEKAAVAEEAPVDDPRQKVAGDSFTEDSNSDSDFVDSYDESEEDDDDLFVENVDQIVKHEGMSKGNKAAATSTTKVRQVNRSFKAMGSDQENSLLGPTENSICPPPEKRQKKLSDKDDEQCDRHSFHCASQTDFYKHDNGDGVEDEQGENHVSSIPSKRPRRRSLAIGAYVVQCVTCRKWRLVPTKEKYEEFRERIIEDPFTCQKAHEWKPDVACEDPSEMCQDGSQVWAMDKHNIPQSPPGWERLIMIRSEGCTRFADVYYTSPTGKKLKSSIEVDNYLKENPEYAIQGVKLSQFSFKIPAPAQPDYVRKRTQTSSSKTLAEEVQPITLEADLGDMNQLVPFKENPPELK